jgi:KipI family sensor histidine kinase inhibitor
VSVETCVLPEVIPAGDGGAMVVFEDEISLEVNSRVHALARALDEMALPGVEDLVVAYCTLLIQFDPVATSFGEVQRRVQGALESGLRVEEGEARLVELPTLYGGCYGSDVPEIARRKGMTEAEVISLHSSATYTVYMLGFAPGFAYLGGLPPELALPRLESPREKVPAGTVAIANQTTIYALDSPGGWWWAGRTPIKMFDPGRTPPTYLSAGNRVRFVPITEGEYLAMGGEKCS